MFSYTYIDDYRGLCITVTCLEGRGRGEGGHTCVNQLKGKQLEYSSQHECNKRRFISHLDIILIYD